MNYLELCKRLRSEAGIAGVGPAKVTDQSGESLRVVEWIRQAWVEIQNLHEYWKFRWAEGLFETTELSVGVFSDTYEFAGADDFDRESMSIYKTADGSSESTPMFYFDYLDFRDRFQFAPVAEADQDQPSFWTIKPDKKIQVYPVPDAFYTLGFDYSKTPQVLEANTDTPLCASRYHMTIIYLALLSYGRYENANEVLKFAGAQYDYARKQMELNELLLDEEMTVIPQ